MPDDLAVWCWLRERVPWGSVADPRTSTGAEVVGSRDGVAHFIRTAEHARDPDRAARMLAALDALRADAAAGRALDFAAMSVWQGHVLGTEPSAFRTGLAFAKGGRERYGLDGGTRRRFEECLRQGHDPQTPLPGRAARTFLDVCFFHPFDDGNARAALLALTFLLARDRVVLDQVGPLKLFSRSAGNAEGALELARLVAVLMQATWNRRPHGTRHRPG